MAGCIDHPTNAPREEIEHYGDEQPPFARPDVREVGDPLLIRARRGELAIQHIGRERVRRAPARIHGVRAAAWPGPERLPPHESGDVLPPAGVARIPNVVQDAPRAVRAVAQQEAPPHVEEDPSVRHGPPARRTRAPRIEATPRDPERPAQHLDRPGPSVFRDEAELHIDSFAK